MSSQAEPMDLALPGHRVRPLEGERAANRGGVGIGWREPHFAVLIESQPRLDFIEVHSENFFADGGATLQVLEQGRADYAVSLHGVGLSLGSACGLDQWHLERLARLVERCDPCRVSDHASFARAPVNGRVVHANDLLPIAFTDEALDLMVHNVQQVQERLKRQLLVENISSYLGFADSHIAEPQFLKALCARSGCGLLLDVNNLVVNALNASEDAVQAACAWVDSIEPEHVGEIHLAGYADLGDIVIDNHGSRVREAVWRVYRHAIQRLGPRPTLIEWDSDIPELPVLLDEAARAQQEMRDASR
ncbi:MAG TPA: DUF692 domain-containing protein [Burkholderiaceae bacterium]